MGNSTEKEIYCSFIGFILKKSEVPKNGSANTCALSQPTWRTTTWRTISFLKTQGKGFGGNLVINI